MEYYVGLDVSLKQTSICVVEQGDEVSPSAHLQLFQPDFSQDYPQLSGA